MLISDGEIVGVSIIFFMFLVSGPSVDFETIKKLGVFSVLLVFAMVNLDYRIHHGNGRYQSITHVGTL